MPFVSGFLMPCAATLTAMPATIYRHRKPIKSVFELLGERENDITFSLGWALAQCPEFCSRVVKAMVPGARDARTDKILLQEPGKDGITDIELKGESLHIILEAKRGLGIPSVKQLERYAQRIKGSGAKNAAIVSVSAASQDFARTKLPSKVLGIACVHASLSDLHKLAQVRAGTHAEKRLLKELSVYVKRIARMREIGSNMVYVVALKKSMMENSDITWLDVVEKHDKYFHPVGGSYPREPVNYIGFRYDGKLQWIRHVEDFEVVSDLKNRIPGCRFQLKGPHYLYTLGAPIKPAKEVRNGKVRMANRVKAAIDLLLTCDTISEAGERTRKRLGRD